LSSCGVEPTQGILAWAERLHAELNELKRRREVHIQVMYDQLEALWRRMGVEDMGLSRLIAGREDAKEGGEGEAQGLESLSLRSCPSV
jgi:hypothetical protein